MKIITQKDIEKIVERIARIYKPEKIYLFGSFVWGKPDVNSDIDLFVVKDTKKNRHERQLKVRRLIRGEIPCDTLVYTPKEVQKRLQMKDFFIQDIINKGKLLYEEKRN